MAGKSFPVFRANKQTHLLRCGHVPVDTERDDRGNLLIHFPADAAADAMAYERTRLNIVALEKSGRLPTTDEILRAVDAGEV